MQHVGCHYSTGNALDFHQMQIPPAADNKAPNATTAVPQSTTSVLRSWRKKDASEKQSLQTNGPNSAPTEQANHTNGAAAETQGPVARVAPHNHYPKPPPQSEVYRYPQQYADFGVQGPPQLPTPVKYSEIIEPMHQSIEQLPPIHLHQKQKEKSYLEMCSVQQNHMKSYPDYQNYKQHYDGLKGYNHLAPGGYNKQYHPHHPPHYALQKESQVPTGYPVQKEGSVPAGNMPPSQYLHNYKITPPGNYPRDIRNYPREAPGNEFLANLNKIAPDMAQDIINDPHLRENQFPMYPMDQNRLYPSQPPQQHHHHTHHHQRMYQRTSPIQIQNYPHQRNLQNFNQYPPPPMNQQRMDPYRMYAPHQRYQQVEQVPSNISPRQYHENVMGFPPRISPNYPPCSQLEYAQHYQHRQVPMRQDFLPIPSKPYIESHPEIPEIVPDDSIHAPKNTLKTFLENWREEFTEEADPSGEVTSEKIQLVKAASNGPNRENTLYVLDTMEIPSENIPQYLHLQPLEKLPPNIRAFAYNPNEDNSRQNAIVISANMKSEDPNKTDEANPKDVAPYQLFQQSKNYYKSEEISSHEDRPACKLLQSMANAKNAQLHNRTAMEKQEKLARNFEENHKQMCRSLPELITEDTTEDLGKNQEHFHNDYSRIVDSILEENIQSVKADEIATRDLENREEIEDNADVVNNVEIAGRKSVIAENQNAITHEEKPEALDEQNEDKIQGYGDEERTITKVTNQHNLENEEKSADDPIDLSQSFEESHNGDEDKTIIEEKPAEEDFIQDEETKHVYTDILCYKNELNLPKSQEEKPTIIEENKTTNEEDKTTNEEEEKTEGLTVLPEEEIPLNELQETKQEDEVKIATSQVDAEKIVSPPQSNEDKHEAIEVNEESVEETTENNAEIKIPESSEDPDSTNKDVEILQITEDLEENDATQNQGSEPTKIPDDTPLENVVTMEVVEEIRQDEDSILCEVQEEAIVELNILDADEEIVEDIDCIEDNKTTTLNEEIIIPIDEEAHVEDEMDLVTEEIVDVGSVKSNNEDCSEDSFSITEEIEEVEANNEIEVPTTDMADFEENPVGAVESIDEEVSEGEENIVTEQDTPPDKLIEEQGHNSECDQSILEQDGVSEEQHSEGDQSIVEQDVGNEDVIEETIAETAEASLEDLNQPDDNPNIDDSKDDLSNSVEEIQKKEYGSSFVLEIAKELLQINVIEDNNGEKVISVTPLTKVKVITAETANNEIEGSLEDTMDEEISNIDGNNQDETIEDCRLDILDEISLIVSEVIDEVIRIEEETTEQMTHEQTVDEVEMLAEAEVEMLAEAEVEMLVDDEVEILVEEQTVLHNDDHVMDAEIEMHNEVIIDSKEEVEDHIPLDPIENEHEEEVVTNSFIEEPIKMPLVSPKDVITNNNYIQDLSSVVKLELCEEIQEMIERPKTVPKEKRKLKSSSMKRKLQKKIVKFDLPHLKKVEALDNLEKAKIFSSVVVIDKIPDKVLAKNNLRKEKTMNNSKIVKKPKNKVRLQEKRFQNNVKFKRKIDLAKEKKSMSIKQKDSIKKDIKKPGKIEEKSHQVKPPISIKDKSDVVANKIKSIEKAPPIEKVVKLPSPKKGLEILLPTKIVKNPPSQKQVPNHTETEKKVMIAPPKIKEPPLPPPKGILKHYRHPKDLRRSKSDEHFTSEFLANFKKRRLSLQEYNNRKRKAPSKLEEEKKESLEIKVNEENEDKVEKNMVEEVLKSLNSEDMDIGVEGKNEHFKESKADLKESLIIEPSALVSNDVIIEETTPNVIEENLPRNLNNNIIDEVIAINEIESKDSSENYEDKPRETIDQSTIEEKVNSLEVFLPKIASTPRRIEESDISRKLDELLAENPISYTQKFNEMALINRFLKREVLTSEELQRVKQIVQYKRAIQSLQKSPIANSPQRRYSSEFPKSIKIDFRDFDMKKDEGTSEFNERWNHTNKVCYNRSITAFIEEQSKKNSRFKDQFSKSKDVPVQPRQSKEDFNLNADHQKDFERSKSNTESMVAHNKDEINKIVESSKSNGDEAKNGDISPKIRHSILSIISSVKKPSNVENRCSSIDEKPMVPILKHAIQDIIKPTEKSTKVIEDANPKNDLCLGNDAQSKDDGNTSKKSTKVIEDANPKNDLCLGNDAQSKDDGNVFNKEDRPDGSPQRKTLRDNLSLHVEKDKSAVIKSNPITPTKDLKVVQNNTDKTPVKNKPAEISKDNLTPNNNKIVSKTKAQLKCFQETNIPKPIDTKDQNLSPVISNLTKLTAILNYYKKGLESGDGTENFKRIEEIIDRLSPNLKNLPNLSEASPSGEYEVSKDELPSGETKLRLHLKKKLQNLGDNNNRKKKKRFRNLYTENESDEDMPKVKQAKTENRGEVDYSVYQRKSPAGVPKLVIKRRKSDIKNGLQPYVKINRSASIETMVKRRKRSIFLNQQGAIFE